MQKKILAIVVIVVIVVAAVAAIQLMPTTPKIKIGLVAPLNSPIGQDMEKAAELAVKEINDAGGIKVGDTNMQIDLVVVDTKDDSSGNAVPAVTNAIGSDKVDMLIGGYSSAGTLASEKPAMDARVPFIITGASNQLVARRGPQGEYGGAPEGQFATDDAEGVSYMFHYCTTTYDYCKTVVDFFAEEMKPIVAPDRNFSLAILYRNDPFGQGVEAATKYWINNENLPISLVIERSYDPTTVTSYQTDLTAVAAANPDAVFVVDNPDKTPTIISQGWNDVGLKTVYIAVENNQDPAFYSALNTQMGSSAAGQLLESKLDPFMSPSYSTAVGTYSEKFKAAYGVMPGMMGADTYDAFFIAKNAIERAGTLDKAAVRQAIEETNMDQLLILTQSGKIQFSTGVNYHEIGPVTFIEQLVWDETANELTSQIVWAPNFPGVSNLKQADFALPEGYKAVE